ncbi:MAG: hypothetical protein K2X66_13605 [Cyanobacteria bacterium]|nr:hypothetical protein [Cyanobacteriota bacterium]
MMMPFVGFKKIIKILVRFPTFSLSLYIICCAALHYTSALAETNEVLSENIKVSQPISSTLIEKTSVDPNRSKPSENRLPENLLKTFQTQGLKGRIHAAIPSQNLYLFSYRNPQNFFDSIYCSVLAQSTGAKSVLTTLHRNDGVILKGSQILFNNQQPHLLVESVEPYDFYAPSSNPLIFPQNATEKPIENPSLQNSISSSPIKPQPGYFLVHAVLEDGHIVVLESNNREIQMLPIKKRSPLLKYTRSLWRGDEIFIPSYAPLSFPPHPTHLKITGSLKHPEKAIQIIDRIQKKHHKKITVEGRLILFPKSPLINRDVWAIECFEPQPLKTLSVVNTTSPQFPPRYFSLVNFETQGLQSKIDEKLKTIWQNDPSQVEDLRHKYGKQNLFIKVSGRFNIVDSNQANAQLVITDLNEMSLKTPTMPKESP